MLISIWFIYINKWKEGEKERIAVQAVLTLAASWANKAVEDINLTGIVVALKATGYFYRKVIGVSWVMLTFFL